MRFERSRELWKCFFTGIVKDLSGEILERRERNWGILEDKEGFLKSIDDDWSKARRKSMFETAERASYVIIAYAFFAGGIFNAIIAPSINKAALILLKLSLTKISLATLILIMAIAAKAKVMKAPREGGESEPDEMLQNAVDVQEQARQNPAQKDKDRRDRAFNRLHKRKIVLTVERRAQWVAVTIATVGIIEMLVGIWLR